MSLHTNLHTAYIPTIVTATAIIINFKKQPLMKHNGQGGTFGYLNQGAPLRNCLIQQLWCFIGGGERRTWRKSRGVLVNMYTGEQSVTAEKAGEWGVGRSGARKRERASLDRGMQRTEGNMQTERENLIGWGAFYLHTHLTPGGGGLS